jgi:hypothetical protein
VARPKTSEVSVTKSRKTLEIASAPAGKTAAIAELFRGFFRGRKPLEQAFFAIAVADRACFRARPIFQRTVSVAPAVLVGTFDTLPQRVVFSLAFVDVGACVVIFRAIKSRAEKLRALLRFDFFYDSITL